MHTGSNHRGRDAGREVAITDQAYAGPGRAYIVDQLFMPRTIQHNNYEVVDIAIQALGDVLQVVSYRRIKLDRTLARRPHHDLVHVTVRRVEQAASFRCREHSDGPGRPGGAQVRAFQRIHRDVDFRYGHAIGKGCSNSFADVEHRRLIALAFSDYNRAAHRNVVHGRSHGFRSHVIRELAVALTHGVSRRYSGLLDNTQELRCQIALQIVAEAPD